VLLVLRLPPVGAMVCFSRHWLRPCPLYTPPVVSSWIWCVDVVLLWF